MGKIETNTPYDDVYRTMFAECDELVFPLLNEAFGEHYTGKEKIIRLANEHYDTQQGGSQEKRITDSFIRVIGEKESAYHVECESGADGSILVRMFQYDSQLALQDSHYDGKVLKVEFPKSAVLFLRSTSTTPDEMKIEIHTPGGSVRYKVPTIKVKAYTLEEIKRKKLYILIPFYLFNLEKDLKRFEQSEEQFKELLNTYTGIQTQLEQAVQKGELQSVTCAVIRDLSNKVAQNLASKYENVKRGIGDIMGGRVLELDALKIRDEGRAEGRAEGRVEGVRDLVSKLLKMGHTPTEISTFTEIPVKMIEEIETANLGSLVS